MTRRSWLLSLLFMFQVCEQSWLVLRPAESLPSLVDERTARHGALRLAGGSAAVGFRPRGIKRPAQWGQQQKHWWSRRLKDDQEVMLLSSDNAEAAKQASSDSSSHESVEDLGEKLVWKRRKRRRQHDAITWLASNPDEVDEGVLVSKLRKEFGLDSFRGGQLAAIKRVVSGQSSLLIAATGSGKSLAYLLPAVVLPGVAIVVSPLLALIKDQLMQLPGGLRGATLSSQMTHAQQQEVVKELKAGKVKILFVAPERLFTDAFQELAASLCISFAAVDEAHCVSEWAHHFRPAYLRLRRVLTDRIGIQCVIGLTATATVAMQADLQRVLRIPPEGVICTDTVRSNLHLSAVSEPRTAGTLVNLIRFLQRRAEADGQEPGGVIVYCSLQRSCDELASALSHAGIAAARYHAGCSDEERRQTQDRFLHNSIEVRAVVHFNCPSSVEEYVQQVGRAGRDGGRSYGVLFTQDSDFARLRSLAHAHAVEDESVTALIRAVLVGGGSRTKWQKPAAKPKLHSEDAMWSDKTGPWEFPETVETILSFLDEDGVLTLLPKGPASITVTLPSMGREETEGELLGAIVNLGRRVARKSSGADAGFMPGPTAFMTDPDELGGRYVVDVNLLCRSVGMSYLQLTRSLKQLDAARNGVEVESQGRSWRVQLHKSFLGNVSSLGASVALRLRSIQTRLVRNVDDLYRLLQSAETITVPLPYQEPPQADRTGANASLAGCPLQAAIHDYFRGTWNASTVDGPQTAADVRAMTTEGGLELCNVSVANNTDGVLALLRHLPPYMERPTHPEALLSTLREDVVDLLQELWGATRRRLSALSITRLLHAIPSPAFPAHWASEHAHSFWGLHTQVDWQVVLSVAEHVLAQPLVQQALRLSRAPHAKASSGERDMELLAWFEAADNSTNAKKPIQTALAAVRKGEAEMDALAAQRVHLPDGYQGEHRAGLRWGAGVQHWQDGSRFEGEFNHDACDGAGRFTFADGAVYEGEVSKGKPEGWGAVREAHRVYRGAWSEGLPHGKGLVQDVVAGRALGLSWVVECEFGRHVSARPCTREEQAGAAAWIREVVRAVQRAKESAARARQAEDS